MRDILTFCRHFLRLLHNVRGVLLVLFAALFACAVFLAWVEGRGLGEAVYLTLITGLTVGYGDIVPATVAGRVLSIVAAVIGVIFLGIVVAIATRALKDSVEQKSGIREENRKKKQ